MTFRKGIGVFGLIVIFLSYMEIMAGTTGKIAGRITDKAISEGLPGTNVVIAGTTSDAEGYYTIIDSLTLGGGVDLVRRGRMGIRADYSW
ncbi:hypothetical protein JXO59_03260 [candidate division KSB1 bacterium]|nr:hypothetical protein [candidate division KSB1 bacterium]